MSRRLLPPIRGASDFNASQDTPPDTCPPEAIRNVRLRTGPGLRQRPGKRPGLARQFGAAIGGGSAVRLLDVITKAAGTTYAVGSTTNVDGGVSTKAGALLGQAWFLDANRGMFRMFRDPYPAPYGSTTPTPGNYGAFACGWHPDGTKAAIACIVAKTYTFAVGGTVPKAITNVTLYNPDTDTALWQTEIEDKDAGGSVPTDASLYREVFVNSVRVYSTFTYVCAGPYVHVLRTSDGVYIKRHALNNWSLEVMDCRQRPDGTLAALYLGNTAVSGPVDDNTYNQGAYFRAGIALFRVETDTSVGGTPLTTVQFGAKKDSSYAYYEDHLHYRISEHSIAGPRGCYPQGFGMGADGSLVVGRTNQGFGPTSSFPPDSAVSPAITVMRITAGTTTAVTDWERDTASIQTDWDSTGWYNDIGVDSTLAPIGSPPAGPEQSVQAIAVSRSTGDIFAAGKRANGLSIHCLSSDGVIKWATDLGGTVYQHCVAVDPASGLVVVAGQRNASWTGAGGNNAHLWWLDPATGEVVYHYDLAESVGTDGVTVASAFGVDVSSAGRVCYCTVHIG